VGAGATVVGRAIQAHLERRKFANVEALLAKLAGQIKDIGLRDIRDYLDMMQNKYVMPPLDPNSPSFEAEKLFSELITGKSVALVGPGSPSGHYGNEIDSANTVVRIKYVGREHLPPQEFHGHRCDISQYNLLDPLIALADGNLPQTFVTDLQLVLTVLTSPQKSIQDRPILNLISSGPTYRTTSTSGIRGLFQLLRYSSERLTIFGFDFYSKIEQYSREMTLFYQGHGPKLGDPFFYNRGPILTAEIAGSFSAHDPVSNFCFAQNLYKAGMFEIEPYGASILALTPYQYVERLEEMLGDW